MIQTHKKNLLRFILEKQLRSKKKCISYCRQTIPEKKSTMFKQQSKRLKTRPPGVHSFHSQHILSHWDDKHSTIVGDRHVLT